MARTPITPRKTPRKRAAAATAVVARASTSAVSLNARIHRILNAATELKRYTLDTSILTSSGGLYYVNPFAGITQGVTISGRLGDKIKIEKIICTGKYIPGSVVFSSVGATLRSTHMLVDDTTLTSSSLVGLGISNYVYGGFPSNGALNDHDNIIIKDNKFNYMDLAFDGTAPNITGWNGMFSSMKTFKNGHDIMFKTGGNVQVDNNYIIVFAQDNSAVSANSGTIFLAVTVFYRDA